MERGMKPIRIAIVGVGNCASSLVQGLTYYRRHMEPAGEAGVGLMHLEVGPYGPGDIEVVAAFDIDRRKVGQPLAEAIFAAPNCTKRLVDRLDGCDIQVQMGEVLDGVGEHMAQYPPEQRFLPAKRRPADVARVLKKTGAEVLLNYLPVGSEQATAHYVEGALEAGVSVINCIPVFVASQPSWQERFSERGIPVVGDDVKAQLGATILHRVLTKLFGDRGVKLDATYQLNVGGNTDFLNMLDHGRLRSKRVSKTEAVQSQLDVPLAADRIHIGPSDYIAWLKDNKVCFLRMEGRGFGGVPLHLELRLSVEDSPNSAGMVIDAIRCVKLARERGLRGPLYSVSAYTMKHPPRQYSDGEAKSLMEQFIRGEVAS
jgi:myo-inositol-1-phosphate synthase